MEIIQFKGMHDLDKDQRAVVNTLSTSYYPKIKRQLKNITSMILHVKVHSKGGDRKKFSTHLKVIAPTRIFESQEDDWDLARTLHKVYKNMENEIKKVFKKDSGMKRS